MRLNHVTLIVKNLEQSMAFYQTLGLVPIVIDPPARLLYAVERLEPATRIERATCGLRTLVTAMASGSASIG